MFDIHCSKCFQLKYFQNKGLYIYYAILIWVFWKNDIPNIVINCPILPFINLSGIKYIVLYYKLEEIYNILAPPVI